MDNIDKNLLSNIVTIFIHAMFELSNLNRKNKKKKKEKNLKLKVLNF